MDESPLIDLEYEGDSRCSCSRHRRASKVRRCNDKDLSILEPALKVAVIEACVTCYRAKMAMGHVSPPKHALAHQCPHIVSSGC